MQASAGHNVLAPISEASDGQRGSIVAGLDSRMPRRSLRFPRPQPAADQSRRYTLQLQAAAALAERDRPPTWRRASSSKRSSKSLGAGRQPPQERMENTYRMGPMQPFQLETAEALLAEQLARMLQNYRYDPQSAGMLSRNLALNIKGKVKQELAGDQQRYKLVVLVSIAEPSAPSGLVAARALWSVQTGDACARAEFRSPSVAATAAVFAFYYE